MPRVTLRNLKIHYQQVGEGPDILLIHGMSCHIAFWWFHIAPQLAKTHRVTAVDLRGHGFTSMTDTGYRPTDLAQDVAALLAHLGIEKTKVLAHSFGGAVASALATENPELVSELILADAWIPSLQPVAPILSEQDWSASLARAQSRGINVEPSLPLVMRGLLKEVLDEHEFRAEKKADQPAVLDEPLWEDRGWTRGRGAFGRFRRGVGGRGARFWSPLGNRMGWMARADMGNGPTPQQPREDEIGDAQSSLHGALEMAVKPGEPSLALRRWNELMRRTDARAEYLDSTSIDEEALGSIKSPVRLVYGARSQYKASAVKLKEVLPQSRLRIIPQAGHYFPLLRPHGLLAAMEPRSADQMGSEEEKTPISRRQRLRLIVSGGKTQEATTPQTPKEPEETYSPGALEA